MELKYLIKEREILIKRLNSKFATGEIFGPCPKHLIKEAEERLEEIEKEINAVSSNG